MTSSQSIHFANLYPPSSNNLREWSTQDLHLTFSSFEFLLLCVHATWYFPFAQSKQIKVPISSSDGFCNGTAILISVI